MRSTAVSARLNGRFPTGPLLKILAFLTAFAVVRSNPHAAGELATAAALADYLTGTVKQQ